MCLKDYFNEDLQEGPSGLLSPDRCDRILAPYGITRHETWACAVEGGNREPRFCAVRLSPYL